MELFDTSVIVQLGGKAIQAWSFLWVRIFYYRFNLFEGYNTTENLGIFFFFCDWALESCSVQSSCSVVSDSLQPHGLQHARLPCPSPTPWIYSNSCPPCQWYHPTISSSVIPFSYRLQSFSASSSFTMSQFFTSGVQSIGASASAWVLRLNIQDWFPLGLTGWNLLAVQEALKSLLQHHSSKASIIWHSAFFIVQLSHPYMTTGKTIAVFSSNFSI